MTKKIVALLLIIIKLSAVYANNRNANGHKSAREFLARLKERKANRDKKMSFKSFGAQLKAIHAWGLQAPMTYQALNSRCWLSTETTIKW